MDKKDKYHLTWDCDFHTSTAGYAGRFSGKTGEFLLGRQNEILARFLGAAPCGKVLDVGAGHGQNVLTALSLGAEYTAFISSPSAGGMLFEKLSRTAEPPPVEYGPLNRLPFGDDSFDAVISFRTMSHVPDWKVFLGELCRVSKKRVIIDFSPEACCLVKKTFFLVKGRLETASREFSTQSASRINLEAQKTGFYLKSIDREFVLPMVVHRLAGGKILSGAEKFAVRLGATRFIGGPAVALLENKEGGMHG